ncbi:MAG TPA: hypothetical protein VFO05_00990 [Candidatus Limnocylindrales bacterium]|nr:hypothetical protein [Candidatus Limnocylindrales bacterium]
MNPLLLVAVGLAALVASAVLLRSFGSRYRIGRLLAATPRVTVADAVQLAETGATTYVSIAGRIDAEDPFEDADHRPLVLRRTRLQSRGPRSWSTFEDSREAVPFEIHEGLDAIAVDGDALDEGLVVISRESEGVAADLPGRVPADLPPSTPVRAVIQQVSAVEHAVVAGVPATLPADGRLAMTAGLGRPLILTTLESEEAMRVLAGGTTKPRLVVAFAGVGAVLVVAGLALVAGQAILSALATVASALIPAAYAATPTPASGGDPRSSGEGPGLVGEPGLALLVVAAIAIAAIALTTLWIRLTDKRGDSTSATRSR